MRLCIWHISKYVAPPTAAKVSSRGYWLMREMVRKGHHCVMITSDSNHLATPPVLTTGRLREDVDGVEVHWLRTLKYDGARSLRRVLSWFDFEWRLWRMPKDDVERPDVVIVSSLSLLSIFNGLALRRRYGCLLIFEVRDIWPLVLSAEGGYSPWNPFLLFLGRVERLAYTRADMVVGTMPNLAAHVENVAGRAIPVHCVPQGVDEALIENAEPLPDDFEDAYFPDGKFTVCHAGTIGVTNALDTFLECARQMQDAPHVRFLLVGDGYLKAQYEARYADLDTVSFAPRVPKSMVRSVLERCDLLYFAVHPSKVLEYGQSLNKVVDYMLSGRPVVASFSGYPSMIDEAESGSFVPAGDVEALRAEILRYAAMDRETRNRIGEAGRKWLLENRRFPKLAADYLRLIEEYRARQLRGAVVSERSP